MKNTIIAIALLFTFANTFGQGKYANDIKKEVDKYDGTTRWSTPLFGKGLKMMMKEPIKLIKTKDKDGNYITYLSLLAYGLTVNVDGTGATLLFEDGDRIENPDVEIDVDVETVATGVASYNYTAFFPIGDEELEKLATKNVDGFKLYIYENALYGYGKNAKLKLQGWVQAIRDAK